MKVTGKGPKEQRTLLSAEPSGPLTTSRSISSCPPHPPRCPVPCLTSDDAVNPLSQGRKSRLEVERAIGRRQYLSWDPRVALVEERICPNYYTLKLFPQERWINSRGQKGNWQVQTSGNRCDKHPEETDTQYFKSQEAGSPKEADRCLSVFFKAGSWKCRKPELPTESPSHT